jgi:meso-butanediol dehydrogenase/(S,S)-butanediol dehydrogenase/diacetyl reductase
MLEGRVALITGAAAGIGAAVARGFVSEGAVVCITGPEAAPLQELAATLPESSVVVSAGDVTSEEDNQLALEAALSMRGSLDILVNNAAVGTDPLTQVSTSGLSRGVAESDVSAWRRTLDVNLTGQYLMMRAALPTMIQARKGSIINIASLGGMRALPSAAAYCASKAGVVMLSQQAAADYGPYGVRVNAVCPGWVRTQTTELEIAELARRTGRAEEWLFTNVARDVPLRRVARADEIASVCSFLASDGASYITGAALVVDGGSSIIDVGTLEFVPAMRTAGQGQMI